MLLIFFSMKKKMRKIPIILKRKLTLKVKFWHFFAPPYFTNSQESIISFGFLRQEFYDIVSPYLKLHNRYCHWYSTCHSLLSMWFDSRLQGIFILGSTVNSSPCLRMSYYVKFLEGLGSTEFHIKFRFGTHGSWKSQYPGGRLGATS